MFKDTRLSPLNSIVAVASAAAMVSVLTSPARAAENDEWQVDVAPFVGQVKERGKTSLDKEVDLPSDKAPSDKRIKPKSDSGVSKSAQYFAEKRAQSKDIVLDIDDEDKDDQEPDSDESADAEDEDSDEDEATAIEEEDNRELSIEDLESDDPNFFLRKSLHHIKAKQYRAALSDVNKCLLLDKRNWHARYLGAYIFQLQGRDDEAIFRYKHFLEVKPDDILANINLATLLKKRGEYEEAEVLYRKAISLNFYSLEAHYNLANLLIETGRDEEALKELHTCLKFDRNNAWVHNNIGVLYQRRNYFDEAAEEFRRALVLEPANPTFEKNLMSIKDRMGGRPATADAADLL